MVQAYMLARYFAQSALISVSFACLLASWLPAHVLCQSAKVRACSPVSTIPLFFGPCVLPVSVLRAEGLGVQALAHHSASLRRAAVAQWEVRLRVPDASGAWRLVISTPTGARTLAQP